MRKSTNRLLPQTLAVAVAACISSTTSLVQASNSGMIEEVIVTAQKRAQSLQDVPLSVSAFSEQTLKDLHMGDANDIFLYTPGLVSAPDYATAERIAIRGLGSEQFGYGFENHVGVFVDGIYQEGTSAGEFYDLERVEVIKGPVGALFGRSAIAGAISVSRNKPGDQFEASLDVGLGNLGHQSYTGVINLPLTEQWSLRAAGKYDENDGYLHNIANGEDLGSTQVESSRLSLRYVGDVVDATFTAVYEERADMPNLSQTTSDILDESIYGFPATDFILDPAADLSLAGAYDDYDVAASLRPFFTTRFNDWIADINIAASDQLDIKLLTSYREVSSRYTEDFDANDVADLTSSGPFSQNVNGEYFQQEVHFTYTTEHNWVLLFGGNYYNSEVEAETFAVTSDTLMAGNAFWDPALLGQTILQSELGQTAGDYWGWSSFVDVTIPLTASLDLTLGARYTFDEKELTNFVPDPHTLPGNQGLVWSANNIGYTSAPVTNKDDWADSTVRAALNYQFNEDISFYASYAQGYKSGGIDTFSYAFADGVTFPTFVGEDITAYGGVPKAVDPETSDSYELGIKSYWLNQRVQFNAAAFYYVFKDQQQLVQDGAALIVENVGEVEGKGLEAEVRFLPTDNLDISVNLGYLDTNIKENDSSPELVGETTPRAPTWTSSLIATYTQPLNNGSAAYFTYSYSYQDEMRTDVNPQAPYVKAMELSNVRMGYQSADSKWDVSLYVDNLFDEFTYYDRRIADQVVFLQDQYRNIGRPRTWGLDVSYIF
ncbi:TonB-dependent receptor [Aestuariicella hydrocarbonica]|uniref:TonB-dependent receptor n=1 Tax=Pseudomaricurvus hydrocarbonicus TaxID=1470433 RepID=A0A9E5JS05_9GAMM|nr:TonB-dependent receptor [Aestuariicella hydrocarbonica]NHO65742.1 TonB-dependent receptor [Aestuariicella hydrocarbonica]